MQPRTLGLVVLRGPNVVLICPTDGSAGTLKISAHFSYYDRVIRSEM